MHRRTARGNRVGLLLTGTVLTLAGAAAIVTHFGVFGTGTAQTALYPEIVDQWVFGHRWVYVIVALLALLGAVLALRWLIVQFRTEKISRIRIDHDQSGVNGSGRTSLDASAITDAIADDAEALRGVRKADAALSGARDAPELWLTVTVDDDADTGAIREQLLGGILTDARTALEKPDMPVYLTLVVSKRSGSRQVA